jgi:hypothetical protein
VARLFTKAIHKLEKLLIDSRLVEASEKTPFLVVIKAAYSTIRMNAA